MSVTRIAVLGVSAAVVAVMIANATTSGPRRTPPQPAVNTTTVELKGAALAAEIARLRARLRPTVESHLPSRNVFEFGARSSPRAAASAPAPPVDREAAPEPPPAVPAVTLVGIATDTTPDGPVRTAIVSAFGNLLLLKEGQNIAYTYRVDRITADGVDLFSLQDGSTLHLALK